MKAGAVQVQVDPQNSFTECFGAAYRTLTLPAHQLPSELPDVLEMDVVP